MKQLILGNCLDILPTLPEKSVHCVITSPPYFGLRDYQTATWRGGDPECSHNPQKPDGGDRGDRTLPLGRGGMYKDTCGICGAIRIDEQIGLEQTPAEYVQKLVSVFRECWRVLRDDGVMFLNLGDSYNGSGGAGGDYSEGGLKEGQPKYPGRKIGNLKPKDLIGIPWRVAFALQDDGWYLRSDIIWHKPNPMPESVTDRPTKSHEYIFLMTKSQRYYYDYEAIKEQAVVGWAGSTFNGERDLAVHPAVGTGLRNETDTRNKRTVWTVPTSPYKGAHFATFPPDLIKPMVLAGCPIDGTVLDPFNGSGTTGEVAIGLGRNYIGIELNPEYIKLAKKRLAQPGMSLS